MKIYRIRKPSQFSVISSSVVQEKIRIDSINKKVKKSFFQSGRSSFEIEYSNTSARQWDNVSRFAKFRIY